MKHPVPRTRYGQALKLNDLEIASKDIIPILIEDVRFLEKQYLHNRKDMASARAAFRAYFSLIEAISYFTSEITLILSEIPELKRNLSEKEKEELAGKRIEIKSGKLIEKRLSNSFLERVKLALKSYSKLHGLNYRIDPQSNGWQCFIKAIDRRHRITHPKKIDDIRISENDYEIIKNAGKWFVEQQKEIDRLKEEKKKKEKEETKSLS